MTLYILSNTSQTDSCTTITPTQPLVELFDTWPDENLWHFEAYSEENIDSDPICTEAWYRWIFYELHNTGGLSKRSLSPLHVGIENPFLKILERKKRNKKGIKEKIFYIF